MKKVLAIAMAAMMASAADAAIIAAWDVQGTGTSNNDGYAATTVAADVSGTPALTRTTVVWTSASNSFNSNTWNLTDTFNLNSNYISFTVTPASGKQLQVESLQYAMNGSNTAPRTARWGYSTDGGSSWTLQDTWNNVNPAPSSLATWDFADFTTSNAVQFRFWAYGTVSISGGTSAVAGTTRIANISGNDLILNGSVIPEPGTAGLVALGLVGARLLRRRMSVNG